ncbi:hypothetical protein COCNU_scaffold022301G000020 [Cocos nucifera]|nr:hypothetical protein [Cocos nucifera]
MARAALAAEPTIKVAAISGSLRKASRTRGLIRCAMELCNESIPGLQIEHVDIEPLPFLNTDLEISGKYPPPVEAFRRKILEADSIFFASPEYNYSLSDLIWNLISQNGWFQFGIRSGFCLYHQEGTSNVLEAMIKFYVMKIINLNSKKRLKESSGKKKT